jgi:hypothetical protein
VQAADRGGGSRDANKWATGTYQQCGSVLNLLNYWSTEVSGSLLPLPHWTWLLVQSLAEAQSERGLQLQHCSNCSQLGNNDSRRAQQCFGLNMLLVAGKCMFTVAFSDGYSTCLLDSRMENKNTILMIGKNTHQLM